MCTAMFQDDAPKKIQAADNKLPNATDVPLGDGMAEAAKLSLLSRRRRIDDALAEAGE